MYRFRPLIHNALFVFAVILQLSACGGGSGGDDDTSGGAGNSSHVDLTNAILGNTPQNVIDDCMDQDDVDMLTAVNQARADAPVCGSPVPPLSWNCLLQNAAIRHSEDMDINGYPSDGHTGSDGSIPSQRVTEAGYSWSWVGENVAGGQRTIDWVMQAWLNSSGHCSNIMSSNYTEFGSSEINFYWTQVFGDPR